MIEAHIRTFPFDLTYSGSSIWLPVKIVDKYTIIQQFLCRLHPYNLDSVYDKKLHLIKLSKKEWRIVMGSE